jgi:hypothetical protein
LVALFCVAGLIVARVFDDPIIEGPTESFELSPVASSNAAVRRAVRPPVPPDDYVGSVVCAECHASHALQYQTHPMSQSVAQVSTARPIEQFGRESEFNAPPLVHTDVGLRYFVELDGDRQIHHEVMVDGEGDVLYDHAVPMDYAIGSGRRGRSYAVNRNGLLFMSPISWYSGKSRWDLSPGYNRENLHFERRILDGCLTCHAGRMANDRQQPNRYDRQPFKEEVIGCERCHGPGDRHVAFRRDGGTGQAQDPIVNPEKLEPWLRDSVCFQCHFKGRDRVARYGRSEFDFRPGEDVRDTWTIFVAGTGVGPGELSTESVSQTEQMLSSVCYQKSGGRLGCISCHDPHSVPAPSEQTDFYRNRCLQCHRPEAACSVPEVQRRQTSSEDSCIECHMPRLDAEDVPHTSQTDHRVLRTYGESTLDEQPSRSALVAIDSLIGRLPAIELERARGLLMVREAASNSKSRLLAADAIPKLRTWLEAADDDVETALDLGTAYALNRDIEQAVAVWEHALRVSPDNEEVLRRLMLTCHDNSRTTAALEYARKLVKINPWNYVYFGRLAHLLGQTGRIDEGILAAERALELNPGAVSIHGWLAEAYSQTGDAENALLHREHYLRLSAAVGE